MATFDQGSAFTVDHPSLRPVDLHPWGRNFQRLPATTILPQPLQFMFQLMDAHCRVAQQGQSSSLKSWRSCLRRIPL